jgi:hypothetical protein
MKVLEHTSTAAITLSASKRAAKTWPNPYVTLFANVLLPSGIYGANDIPSNAVVCNAEHGRTTGLI